jgi:ERCC4-type nuclease
VKILVDTREQLPLFQSVRTTLGVGDYTTRKLLGKFHIERKSLSDLYGTLTSGNQRFKYELFRAAWDQIQIEVYVEGTRENFVAKKFPKGDERKFTSAGLDRLIATFERKYHLHFHWHPSRAATRVSVEKRLQAEEKRIFSLK